MQIVEPVIAEWQVDRHEIGMLQFFPSDAASERFPFWSLPSNTIFLGVVESDALCLMHDGTLCVFDHEVAGRVVCHAASNQTDLIAALKAMDDYFERCSDDDAFAEDESAAIEMREWCTAMVGGPDFASFIQLFFWA